MLEATRVLSQVFHRVPSFRGRGRLLWLLNTLLLRRGGVSSPAVAQMRPGHRMLVDLRSKTEFHAYYTGEYDAENLRAVAALADPNWIALDIGANIGFHTVPLALTLRSLQGQGKLYCFEPVPSNRERLEQNLALNGARDLCQIHEFGLSNAPGEAQITLREDFEFGSATGNAALVIQDGLDAQFRTLPVSLKRLDDWVEEQALPRLDFIKIDVEGHEDLVFEGALKTLARFRPILLAEMNNSYFQRRKVELDARMTSLLGPLGYEWIRYFPLQRRWRKTDTLVKPQRAHDVFLVPHERSEALLHVLNAA
jgi:FkbM family methyltransferase